MIVSTMSEAEMVSEIHKDFPELAVFTELKDKEYRRAVIKASKFPFFMRFYKKTKGGNRWMLIYEARKKKDRKNSRIHFVLMIDTPRGFWALMPTYFDDHMHCIFFMPHFFSRYRQRCNLEESRENLIYKYFRRNPDYIYEIATKQEGEVSWQEVYGSCKDGVALGVATVEGNVFFKTFITYEMTKGQQIETFARNEEIRRELSAKN
ncbi:hypothetical protein SAMN05443429_108102 [Cruoricaptor ignavus]|uniref:Uncharacterized protein n=1 Tax=Cruoricaptor ignavus TaxID=1118202 RepID=A0A1M6G8Z9_9FLAO|nr:hypothetical protein [Cruoricaptor ignavus]SHJ06436.1 hypothetical protein SAMN05443429_108102 [Cruoricaptor ignavus]